MNISTVVYDKKPEWNFLHQEKRYTLHPSGKSLSEGKAKRLLTYAIERMESAGFPCFETVEIFTTGDEGYYHVSFTNDKGGSISLQGILLNRGGWPFLDHGFSISCQ